MSTDPRTSSVSTSVSSEQHRLFWDTLLGPYRGIPTQTDFEDTKIEREAFLKAHEEVFSASTLLKPAWHSQWHNRCKNWKERADLAYYLYYNGGAYTNLWMFDYMLVYANLAYADLWTNPGILKANLHEKTQILEVAEELGHGILHSGDRCSLFALNVSERLWRSDSIFDFEYFDVGRHRITRCWKTGLVIDSGSPVGPIVVDEKKWKELENYEERPKWRYEEGTSELRSLDRKKQLVKRSADKTIKKEEGLTQCLQEIVDLDHNPLIRFRSFKFVPTKPEFGEATLHGMIKWKLKDKQVHLMNAEAAERKEYGAKTIILAWGMNDTRASKMEYLNAIDDFITEHGGPHGWSQWGECSAVHMQLMDAATDLWGIPHVIGKPKAEVLDSSYNDDLTLDAMEWADL